MIQGAGKPTGRRRYDREIFGLALPALGALAAEPTYVLVDTAIVGHLGTPQLAALALAATLLSTAITLFNFLTYGTTARVARLHGAGEATAAGRIGAQALWLSVALGGALLALILILAGPAVALMGGSGETAEMAVAYLRISALGIPFAMVALAGQGFLRGVGNLRTPLVILVSANVGNAVLEVLFVYGFGWGLAGSAWGTVIAQLGMGGAFVYWLLLARRTRAARAGAPCVRFFGWVGTSPCAPARCCSPSCWRARSSPEWGRPPWRPTRSPSGSSSFSPSSSTR